MNYGNILKFNEPISPKEYGMEACFLMGVLDVLINDYSTCCCYLLSIVVDFMILSDIYCFLF